MALQHVNNLGASGSLSAGIAIDADSFTLGTGEGTDFPDGPSVVQINDEFIEYATKVGDTFSGLFRGFDNSTAAAHSATDTVTAVVTAAWFESAKTSIESIAAVPPWVGEVDTTGAVEGDVLIRGAAEWIELYDEKDTVSISATSPPQSGTQDVDKLVDRTTASYRGQWGSGPNEITFDFGEAVTIGRFLVDTGGYGCTVTKIEYSNDGSSWSTDSTPSAPCPASTDGVEVLLASQRTARYFRITVSSAQYVPDWKEIYFYENASQWLPEAYAALPSGAVAGDTVRYEAAEPETLPMTGYTVEADYTYSAQTADLAVDNDPGTFWQDDGNNGAFRVDLGAAEAIERVKVAVGAQNADFGGKTVRISYSDTAITGPWTVEGTYDIGDVHDIDGNGNPGWPVLLSAPATHQYWRLDDMGAWAKLYWLEFQKSGTPSWNPVALPNEVADLDYGGGAPGDGDLVRYVASAETDTVKADVLRMFDDDIYNGASPDILIDGTSSTIQTGGKAVKHITFDYGPGNAKTVTKIKMETDSTLGTWTVEGSNDYSSWTTLQTGIVNSAVDTPETFTLGTTGTYRYYRLTSSGAAWTILRTMIPVYTVGQWEAITLVDLKAALNALP